ncbi:hypothetical protein OEA41_003737 [Lepraria neglecta]|uniref:Uncharacterized protein n=1 Tax=Lepraria neglecta TaxID=209136 RepID=A0AAD9Z8Z0_9LECA|nr:hypothetical protein OEA41_003737 [Lepraria neglecta]
MGITSSKPSLTPKGQGSASVPTPKNRIYDICGPYPNLNKPLPPVPLRLAKRKTKYLPPPPEEVEYYSKKALPKVPERKGVVLVAPSAERRVKTWGDGDYGVEMFEG